MKRTRVIRVAQILDSVRQTGRNLVVCIDNVQNEIGQRTRNIGQLHSQLVKDKTQLTYYNSGIGTYGMPSKWTLDHWIRHIDGTMDFGIAWDFERIVKEAYRWLAEHYQDGDVIYCFGYSRGACLVLTLAAMIDKVGLVHKGNEELLAYVYALYIDSRSHTPTKGSESMAQQFKQTYSRNVRVHFVGVWDALVQVGLYKHKASPGTNNPYISCYFRHALALDERRVIFLPLYACFGESGSERRAKANGSDSPPTSLHDLKVAAQTAEYENLQTRSEDKGNPASPRIKEVWFSGTHHDIGGGNVENGKFNFRHPSFLWMSYEATSMRLKLNGSDMEWRWCELGDIRESLTGLWKLLEYLPIRRLTYNDNHSITYRPHWGRVEP
ncbi:hypothetical protein A0H81_11005 [Grifola frondosa]|uniref:T6SS Phospholipase effector Tle1-like catalytic domain-containing protein n=1 Tax=Grifola frondosa TaxID=5627 RepID=A0A1C7LY39_GRIFR|nr:hypothetical protein A0H81_11005 [Grifola frondosa]